MLLDDSNTEPLARNNQNQIPKGSHRMSMRRFSPKMISLLLLILLSGNVTVHGYTLIATSISCRTYNGIHMGQPPTGSLSSPVLMGLKNFNDDDKSKSDVSAPASTSTSTATAVNNNNDEAQRLLDKVKQMRMEIAALTGQTIEDVEREAALKKSQQQENETKYLQQKSQQQPQQRQYIVPVPETVSEQIQQAANAIERAYNDGNIQKQIIRFAFVPIVTSNDPKTNNERDLDHQNVLFVRNDQDWPGGIQQIYREAARPYTYQLLQQLRIRNYAQNAPALSSDSYGNAKQKPLIQEQTLWDFDGSAIITAENRDGSTDDNSKTSSATTLIQALVHPNTDNRYFNDITQIDERLSKSVTEINKNMDENDKTKEKLNGDVNLIVNPFWTNATSWGYNIFAPQAQQRANEIIFSPTSTGGYIETYSVITKTVRGEDCVAIKAYPYDWQLYAYFEETSGRQYYGAATTTIHLGSSVTEPTITDFVQLLSNRTEFQYSKNMRQMQRTLKK